MPFDDNIYIIRRKESSNYRHWTDEDIRLLCKYLSDGLSNKEIAVLLNRKYGALNAKISEMGLSRRRFYSIDEIAFIHKCAGSKSCYYIASSLGRSVNGLLLFCMRNNISLKCYGDNVSWAKIPDEDIILMRALRDEGLSYFEIGEKFDIHQNTVRACCVNRSIASEFSLKHEIKLINKDIKNVCRDF